MSPSTNRLIERTGPNPGMVFDLTKEITTLGRDVTNDIVLGDAEVSRQHARLTRTPGGFVLEDLGSTNGTYVNGDRLTAPRVLRPGDLVGLSEKVTLTFESTAPESAETVVTPAAGEGRYAATVREDLPLNAIRPPSEGPPTPTPRPQPVAEEKSKLRSPWLIAGCGCLLIIVVLGVVFWYMDTYYPDTLYAPLKFLGF